ncbi:MAG TPA: DUF2167 domain-containing protein [Steroidobacteraceae bacterium]|nr:DUF2167 domain-containing protein [Steroidobacteraceae bacterium]
MRAVTIATAGLALWASIGFGTPAWAGDDPAPAAESSDAQVTQGPVFNYQTGNIVLPNKVATLRLAGNYRYLDPAETEKLLVAWGNEPGSDTQGAIVPNDIDPMTGEGWAVILSYEDEGHIDDSDAADIDYDDMLADMKEGTEDHNEARKDAGYQAVHLVGWAEKPHYDAAAKKLYWAKELDFEGSPVHTLNYDVRVLGREGVLSMNAVASMSQLAQIRSDMRPLIEVAEFNEGHRYAEFNSKTDRMAEYGLGALIAGGVAAKLGLFGKLAALLVAFKKFIIVGVLAIGGFIAKLFGRKKDAAA